jgi:hypothetical protein
MDGSGPAGDKPLGAAPRSNNADDIWRARRNNDDGGPETT